MIQLRFKLTWPLAILILIAVAAWLLRHASRAQAQPATRPIHYATVVNVPPADGHQDDVDPLEQILRDGQDAARRAYARPNEYTTIRQQFEERRRARKTANASR